MTMTKTKIAIFPIPNCITFPGTVMPLHVFEPRYRDMVNYCLENDMPLAVCHTQKVVREIEPSTNLEEMLGENASTYKPFSVFSAGRCELLETTDDGRMMLNVHLQQRYHLLNEVQTLPFTIAQCEPVFDDELAQETLTLAEQAQEKILMRLLAITHAHPEVATLLQSEVWRLKTAVEFSFEILGILQFEAEDMQDLLEMTDSLQRLESILALINKG
jgi:Lon protease-like protein